jgi:hypothetical protein
MARILFGLGTALVALPLCGQEPQTPAFPVETELVVLDMVVRDADGQPVTDLRPGEVEVFEDGLPGLIESFRLVRPGTPVPLGGAAPQASGEVAPAPATGQASPEEEDASESPLRPNIVILVFDRLGLEAARAARQAATDFARREFPEETWVLQQAGAYVLGYEDAFRTEGASEQLREWYEGGTTEVRTLKSDVVFAMVAGPSPWVLYRDVFQVSGHDLREDDHRLQRLFRESPGAAPRKARVFQRDSERHLRPPERRMWVPLTTPTAALAYLHPDNRDRFRFELGERSTRDGDEVVTLEFEEVARPTLVRDGSGRMETVLRYSEFEALSGGRR